MPTTPADLLSRFPGPLRLYPSRWTYFSGILIALFFLGVSLFFDNGGAVWIGLAVSGGIIVTCLASISPQANSLTLHRDGFDVRFSFRRMTLRWDRTRNFTPFGDGRHGQIMFRNDDLRIAEGDGPEKLNAGLSRTYGMTAEQLADLMSQWRERALASSS